MEFLNDAILDSLSLFTLVSTTPPTQSPFLNSPPIIDHPLYPPRIDYSILDSADDATTPPPDGMILHPLHVSGPSDQRVDLTFFADGCKS